MVSRNKNTLPPLLVLVFACLSFFTLNATETKPVLIKNGKLFTISGEIIEKGDILIKQGKISAVGSNLAAPAEAQVIDASGLCVMPGLIDSYTDLGASDIYPADRDSDEATAPLTPHLSITDGFYPGNRFIPLARKSGITLVLCAPGESNLLSGRSALIRLAGESLEEIVIKSPAALHGNMGETPKLTYGARNQYPSTRMGTAALLRQTLTDAAAYGDKKAKYRKDLNEFQKTGKKERKKKKLEEPSPPSIDFKMEALLPVLGRTLPLALRANRYDDILSVLRIAEEFELRIILNHGAEAHRLAQKLAEKNIPVLTGPTTADYLREETSRANPENASILKRSGVKIAFQTGSFRNCTGLIEQARRAAAGGLPLEEARRGLTLSPAEIFGIADRFGSLEKGKAADIVLFDGDPLTSPARTVMVIIDGRVVEDMR